MIVFCLLAVLAVFGGCDTRNRGTSVATPSFVRPPQISAFGWLPFGDSQLEGTTITLSVRWNNFPGNGAPPVNAVFDAGGAGTLQGEPDRQTSTSYSDTIVSQDLLLRDVDADSDFSLSVTLTDAYGQTGHSSHTLRVLDDNGKPEITDLTVAGTSVTVSVLDLDGDDLTVSLDSTTGGLVGSPGSADVRGGSGSAVFTFVASDIIVGGSGTATFTVSDGQATDTDTSGTIVTGDFFVPVDSLAAIPLTGSASVTDTVKVLVATGPLANPFQFMTGVSIVFPDGCDYSANSFDYGAPVPGDPPLNPVEDKDQETVDGIWTVVSPTGGFLTVGDNLLTPDTVLPAPFDSGFHARDFNITPLSGSDAPAGTMGILFNFNLEFSAAGSYSLKFLDFDEVQRSYYQSIGVPGNLLWTDIANSNGPVMITVSE
jgi:hypothetical protein